MYSFVSLFIYIVFLVVGSYTVSCLYSCDTHAIYLLKWHRTNTDMSTFPFSLHGDHIFGLPGLLLSLQVAAKLAMVQKGKRASRHIVEIYGPVGLYNFIASTLSLSCSELKWLTVEVYELKGGLTQHWQHPGGLRNYSEFRHRGLIRKEILPNDDGTWTISKATEIETEKDVLLSRNSEPLGEYVYAAEVQHVPKVQSFGYVIREPRTQPWHIDKDKAVAAGVLPGKKYKLLKCGFSVLSDDESKMVQPEDVLLGDRNLPRSVAFLGDCCSVPKPMLDLCQEVDLLVHEATFLESDEGNRVEFGGHSTATQAARVANTVQAKCLVLNHIASGSFFRNAEMAIVQEARNAVNSSTKVQLGYDHLEVMIPRKGWSW
jgi:ribonuclease Z